MTKKSLGYVDLEWTCPSCSGRNSGREEICIHCGAPQPEGIEFEQAAEEKIIEDATVVESAKIGPDIHCAYCGTRNPGDATHCSQCGADLTEGTSREAGRVLGAHKDKTAPDIKCDYCGTMNPGTAHQCKNCGSTLHLKRSPPIQQVKKTPAGRSSRFSTGIIIAIGAVLVAACIGLFIFLNRTDDVIGQVNNLSWERQIVILGLATVSRTAWRDEIPPEADLGMCQQEHRYTSQDPQPNSTEACGTPYTVDTGAGLGEVVQDCEYLVYDDRCDFTVLELQPVDRLILSGTDLDPQWPAVRLETGQQEGEREESYRIVFSADGEQFTYITNDPDEYQNFTPGSNWNLKVNQLGGVNEVEPAP